MQGAGPYLRDETAAETERLAQNAETLSQQQTDPAVQPIRRGPGLSRTGQRAVPSDKLAQTGPRQQASAGQARVLTDQERLLASEVKQLERQLISQSPPTPACTSGAHPNRARTRNLAQEQQRLQRELRESAAQTERAGAFLVPGAQSAGGFQGPSVA